MDLRDEFRPAVRNCSSCRYWQRSWLLSGKHGVLEAACTISDADMTGKLPAKRGSDTCGSWAKS